MKVIIISQPKAGTYLAANLLQEFNLYFDGYHLSENYYHKYDLDNLKYSVNNPNSFKHNLLLKDSIKLIKENHFSVGHIEYTDVSRRILKNHKKIILTREFSEIQNSWYRFTSETSRKKTSYKLTVEFYKNIIEWNQEQLSFNLSFNDIIHHNIDKINSLQMFLFDRIIFNSNSCICNALSNDSLTKSSIRK